MVATHLITHGCFLLWIRRRINTLSLHMPQMLKVIRPKKVFSSPTSLKISLPSEKLKTLGVVKALKTSDNTPLAVMRTGQLRRNDGSLAQGMQTANITVRSDAEYAINILGTVIHPGKLKKYSLTSELVKTLRFRFFRLSTGLRVKATSSSSSHNLTNYRRPPPLLCGAGGVSYQMVLLKACNQKK